MKMKKWILITIIILVVIGIAVMVMNSQGIEQSLGEQLQKMHKIPQH
jgi:hypothetical protein